MKLDDISRIYRKRLLTKKPQVYDNDPQLNYIKTFIPQERTISILDAGCGNGKYALALASQGYHNIHAVDLFDSVNIDGVQYRQASVDRLPFDNGTFDFIYSTSVIFYLDDPTDAIAEFARVLKDGGKVIITAHTKYSLFTLWRIIKRDFFRLKCMEHLDGVNFYSAKFYKKSLLDNGCDIVLQDGYYFSFILYPFYIKIVRIFNFLFGLKLPVRKTYITNNRWLGAVKSELSYHSVFVAVKRKDNCGSSSETIHG